MTASERQIQPHLLNHVPPVPSRLSSLRRLSTLLENKLLSRKSSNKQRLVIVHMAPQASESQAQRALPTCVEGDASVQTEASWGDQESPRHTLASSPPRTPTLTDAASQDNSHSSSQDRTSPGPPSLPEQQCAEQAPRDTRFSVTDAAELLAHTTPLIGDEWASEDGSDDDDDDNV